MPEVFPNEIYLLIAFYLDPITLITFSQVNRNLRGLVNPQRTHFVQRVLALELIEAHGGPSLRYQRSTSSVHPSFDDVEAWAKMRFTCSGCLKLLSHHHFDNHMLLKRGFRKPLQGSRAEQLSRVSDWAPDYGSKRFWIEKQDALLQEKRIADSTRDRLKEARFDPWAVDPLVIDTEESELGMVLGGTLRHRRMCNECQYQRGHLNRRTDSNRGFRYKVPIIKSRVRVWYEVIKRSGLTVVHPSVETPLSLSRISIESLLSRIAGHRSMYMVRCPGCSVWKEFADFRPCGKWREYENNEWHDAYLPLWITGGHCFPLEPATCCAAHESQMNRVRCADCFSKQFGPQCFRAILDSWWSILMRDDLAQIAARTNRHWFRLVEEINDIWSRWPMGSLPLALASAREIRKEADQGLHKSSPYRMQEDSDIERLDGLLRRWKSIIDDNPPIKMLTDPAKSAWHETHDYVYQQYRWLLQCDAWVKENSLVDFVLTDPAYRRKTLFLE